MNRRACLVERHIALTRCVALLHALLRAAELTRLLTVFSSLQLSPPADPSAMSASSSAPSTESLSRFFANTACTDSFVVSDGTRIAYKTSGPSTSPNKVVLIMGFLTDGAAWAFQSDYFAARGFHVLYYDNRSVDEIN